MTDLLPFWLFPLFLLAILAGFPVAFALMGTALIFGYLFFDNAILVQLVSKVNGVANNFELVAIPLFVFMGALLERSGIAEKLLDAMHLWTRRLPGGLALGTLLMCVIFAACTGVIGATETIVGLLAAPVMLRHNYDKPLISGVICMGGSLGTIIPPSVVAVVLAPLASVSVGDLFVGMTIPGLLLAALGMIYVLILCMFKPTAGPVMPITQEEPSTGQKILVTVKAILPASMLVVCVLGSIVMGLAAPSEAAAIGALGSFMLSVIYRRLTFAVFQDTLLKTLTVTVMIMFIILGGNMFTGVFIGSGGGELIEAGLRRLHFSPWSTLALGLSVSFLAGFFLDWVSVLLIFVPIFMPILRNVGFDPLWVSVLFMLVIQTSYLTPPMAPAIFYFRAIKPDAISTADIMRGVVPFIAVQLLTIALVCCFPSLVTWLPNSLR